MEEMKRVRLTKDENIISKEEVRDIQRLPIQATHIKTRHQPNRGSYINQLTKSLYNNNKQQRRQRISLTKPSRAQKKTTWTAINQNGELSKRDA